MFPAEQVMQKVQIICKIKWLQNAKIAMAGKCTAGNRGCTVYNHYHYLNHTTRGFPFSNEHVLSGKNVHFATFREHKFNKYIPIGSFENLNETDFVA